MNLLQLLRTIWVCMLCFLTVDCFAYTRVGLIAEYNFSDNSALDSSGNGNHGIIHDTQSVEDRDENPSSAMLFNGQNAWIEIPSSTLYNTLSSITISMWICPQKGPNGENCAGSLVGKQPSGSNSNYHSPSTSNHGGLFDFDLCYQDNALKLYFCSQFNSNGSEGHIANMPSLEYDQWQHIAITANRADNRVRFYVNGELVDDVIYSAYINIGHILSQVTTEPIRIGKRKDADFIPSLYFMGAMDDIKIYNRSLLADEIAELTDIRKYSVTLHSNGGSDGTNVVLATYNEPMPAAPLPSRTGWIFNGYYDQMEGGVQYYTPTMSSACNWLTTSNMTLYAQWTPNTYTLTLNAAGGAVNPASKSVTYDSAYGDLPTPVRTYYSFAGWWTGLGSEATPITTATLVSIAANHAAIAKWVKLPYVCSPKATDPLSSPGTYEGFLYAESMFDSRPDFSVRGTLTLSVSARDNKMTASVRIQQKTLSFRSPDSLETNTDGMRHVVMTIRSGELLDLYVWQTRMWGTLSGGALGDEILTVDGIRDRFANKQDVAAQELLNTFRGYYTLALPAYDALSLGEAQAEPEGCGYLTLSVGDHGKASIVGVLADGTKISRSSQLILFEDCGPNACLPFFAPLYGSKGWAGGLLWLDPVTRTIVTDRELGWFLRWEQPGSGSDGFSVLLDVCGGFYSALDALATHYRFSVQTNAVPFFYPGSSASIQPVFPSDIDVTVDGTSLLMTKGVIPHQSDGAYNYAASENSSMAKLTFKPATGVFKGSFRLYYDYLVMGRLQHKIVSVPYEGVLAPKRSESFESLPVGLGFYLVPDNNPALGPYSLNRSYLIELKDAK